jgi:hypothetical protein
MTKPHTLGFGVVGLALILSGCDFVYGVSREAPLETEISVDCVKRAIESTPAIEKVDYEASHTGKGLFHPTPWVYTYEFRGSPQSNISGVLQVYKEYDGKLFYRDYLESLNFKPPQAWIDATRPVMRGIEERLAMQCGADALPARVKETCNGVTCGPL